MLSLTFMTDDDKVFNVSVDGNEPLENLKAILEVDSGIPIAQQMLMVAGRPAEGATVTAAGIQNGDLVMLIRDPSGGPTAPPAPDRAAAPGPQRAGPPAEPLQLRLSPVDGTAVDPQGFMDYIRNRDPHLLPGLSQQHPALADAVRNGDVAKLQDVLRSDHARKQEALRKQQLLLTGDPMDPEVQALIQEQIQRQAVEHNMELAMEYNPEVFGNVFMLYVNAEVNGHKLKAFVDSGAQMSIMTVAAADACGLGHLVDKRWSGLARGVGSAKIVGRVHQTMLKVEGKFLPISITVLEQKGGPQCIIGLDMLKRFQCCIDLAKNELRFTAMDVALPFLAEHELPKGDAEEEEELLKALADGKNAALSNAAGPTITGASAGAPAEAAAAAGAAALARAGVAAGGSGAGAAAVGGSLAAGTVQEEKIKRLTDLGFPRTQAQAALEMCNGNEEMAAAMLFGG